MSATGKTIRPTTLTGIKRLAKRLKSERNTTYTRALNLASQAAGFTNFMQAQSKLRKAS